MFRLALVLLLPCQLCFGQGKDYPDFSKIKARFDVCFSTDLTVYEAPRRVAFRHVFDQFISPEYDWRIGLDIKLVKNISLGPMIGLNYSVRRNGESEGIVMTTHGNERVSYFIQSSSLGFNSGLQAKWHCFEREKSGLILTLSSYYSHLVRQEVGLSQNVDGYPSIDGRVKSVLQGRIALRYAYNARNGFNIEPLIGLSYNIPLIDTYPQGVRVFPISPCVGLAFTFGKAEPKTTVIPNPGSSTPSAP